MIKLYNTLTRKKEIFKPIKEKEVRIYTCGPTVYWYQHIGNLRSYVFPDILKRLLKAEGYNVIHVINVTDVGHLTSNADTGEDKIEKAARNEGKTAKEISDYYFNFFKEDIKKLNIIEPNFWPRATEHIKEQIELIKRLEEKGFTYKTSDGIYFDTSKVKDYGKLAKINIKGLLGGKRISLGEKRNKTDFALWKFSERPGLRQQEWDSPWGIGFPGWHIECSAMSMKYLGEMFDIHTGGEDHIPIHHTNEIAQSESATGKKFVNYWLHGAFLTFKGEKVSKSKGGFLTLSNLEEKNYSPLDLRYLYLSVHYRKPLEFSFNALDYAKNSLKRLKEIISKFDKTKRINKKNVEKAESQFLEFFRDDLNSPKALSYLWDILRENRLNETEKYYLINRFDNLLGLDLSKEYEIEIPEYIRRLVEERNKYREKGDFKTADKIREKICDYGFFLEDNKDKTIIKKRNNKDKV
ncbi:MAG: cysteine--tRNA ligase [Candidatus Pacearchaeota archaeon]